MRLRFTFIYVVISIITISLVVFVVLTSETLSKASTIGEDECFEVTKGLLWSNDYVLYKQVWNNQPPLHTVLLGLLFKCFGPSIIPARVLALCFGILLFVGCFVIVQKYYGMLAAYVAIICLITSPVVLKISISAMLEVPAFALAIWALYPIQIWKETRRPYYLLLSGFLLATALQIKLTSALVIPALALELLCSAKGLNYRTRVLDALWINTLWFTSVIGSFCVYSFTLGGNYEQMWASLFSPEMSAYLKAHEGYSFSIKMWSQHMEGIWGAGIGVFLILWRQDIKYGLFPIVMLGTVMFVHFNHRPYWDYYYLHFAIPMAMLTGYGVSTLIQSTRCQSVKELLCFPFTGLTRVFVGLCLIYSIIWTGGARFLYIIERISCSPRIEDVPLIDVMKKYRERTKWVYARHSIYPFHARLLVIPEIAVFPDNRIWSKRISNEVVLSYIKKYKPEQLLIDYKPDTNTQWYIEDNYTLKCEDVTDKLYVIKSIDNSPQGQLEKRGNP